MNRGEAQQPQIDSQNRADYQANRDDMDRLDQGKQQVVLADVVRQCAVLEI